MQSTYNKPIIQKSKITTALNGNGWFGKYGPEKVLGERKLEIKEDETLKKLTNLFGRYELSPKYDEYLRLIKKIDYSSKDVTNFSLALLEFQEDKDFENKAGFFLNALVDICKDQYFVIVTEHLTKNIYHIGYKNTKNITIKGDIGNSIGSMMEGGTLTVEGNAGNFIGQWMKNGNIYLNGTYEYLNDNSSGGRIYHQGKLIMENGIEVK